MRRRPLTIAVFGVLLLATVSACGRAGAPPVSPTLTSGPTAGAAGSAAPAVPGIDYGDPDQVCRGFVRTMLTSDTTTDAGPWDALRRAAGFLSYAPPTQPPPRGEARWSVWKSHRARVEVELLEWQGELPGDTPAEVTRAVTARTTPVGADGWRGPVERTTVYCALGRFGSAWRVTGYDADYLGPESS